MNWPNCVNDEVVVDVDVDNEEILAEVDDNEVESVIKVEVLLEIEVLVVVGKVVNNAKLILFGVNLYATCLKMAWIR